MDMDVDIRIFEYIKGHLNSCGNRLSFASSALSGAVSSAGQSLEGRQYSLSVQETNASRAIIDASVENLSLMKDYMDRLESDVNEYLKCTYQG